MKYASSLYEHIDQVEPRDWDDFSHGPHDLATDRRLLRAFQQTMSGQCRCWYLVLRDECGAAVATASLTQFHVDALETAGPAMRAITRIARRACSRFLKFPVMFCGLPVPPGDNHFRIRNGADRSAVLGAMHSAITEHASRTRSALVVWKEFDPAGAQAMAPLERHGYLAGDVPTSYVIHTTFTDFDQYCAALRSGYRRQISQSQAKFRKAGCTVRAARGEAIPQLFTDEVHALYLAVRNQAHYRMETLPASFFREVAQSFGQDASLTLVHMNGQLAAFSFGLAAGEHYHNLYVGFDYQRNPEADLYFNVYQLELDHAMRNGARYLHLGHTSDDFKLRLGANPVPLCFYLRAMHAPVRFAFFAGKRWILPPIPRRSARNVWR